MYKLYANRNSGHSYKVALMLEICEIEYELIDLDLSIPRGERCKKFQAHSRFGEVPVLVIDNQPLCQSNNILQHLAHQEGKLGGETKADQLTVREWLYWEANRIGYSVSNLRFSLLFSDNPAEEVLVYLEKRTRFDLKVLDATLSETKYLVGDELTIADVCCCGYLFWLSDSGLNIREWPNVFRWLARISSHPRWQHPTPLMTRIRRFSAEKEHV